MQLQNYAMFLPSYSIGPEVYDQLGGLCRPWGGKVLVIGGRKALAAAMPKLTKACADAGLTLTGPLLYGTDCTFAAVERLRNDPLYAACDMVFAVGGGKAIDTCKALCVPDHKPIFTFPTIASNCAACTAVSIMYNEDGTFLRPFFLEKPATHTFIDTDIIVHAPARYMWAGIGDTYAKYYESTISSRDETLPHFTQMGVMVSRMCLEPLVQWGPQGLADHREGRLTGAVEQVVLAIVISTGLASNFLTRDYTPDYNSGLAHAIFYALTKYPVIEAEHLHGEVVGFGVLFALLVDGQEEEFTRILRLNRALGLPTRLSDIGITPEQFEETVTRIPAMSDVRHYPYAVTEAQLHAAWKRLEEC